MREEEDEVSVWEVVVFRKEVVNDERQELKERGGGGTQEVREKMS